MTPGRSSREEHLAWAKARALRHLDAGDLAGAFASMAGDLGGHPQLRPTSDTLNHLGSIHVKNGDTRGLRRWIEGFQ